jgi:hypothetical protein
MGGIAQKPEVPGLSGRERRIPLKETIHHKYITGKTVVEIEPHIVDFFALFNPCIRHAFESISPLLIEEGVRDLILGSQFHQDKVLQLIERGDTFVLRESIGRNSLRQAASLVFLTAATGAGIIAADLGHAVFPILIPEVILAGSSILSYVLKLNVYDRIVVFICT